MVRDEGAKSARQGRCLDRPPIAEVIRNEMFFDDQARAAIEEGLASGAMGLHDYDTMGEGALHWAAQSGRVSLLEWLVIEMGADLEARDKWEMTPLMCICQVGFGKGDSSAALELLRLGADPLAVNHTGWGVIHWAAEAGMLDVCQRVVEMGALVSARTTAGDTCWILANQTRFQREADGGGPGSEAQVASTRDFFDGLLALGSRVNERGEGGKTALHHASSNLADEAAINYLLERGADPNVLSDESFTPLALVCKRSFLKGRPMQETWAAKVAAVLLLAGADPELEDQEGWCPAMGAPVGEEGCAPALATVRAWMEAKAIAEETEGQIQEGKPGVGRGRGAGGARI